ncbi:hypothetical protein ACLMJK_004604 [Lecanora helva]
MAVLIAASVATLLVAFHFARAFSKPNVLRQSIPSPRTTLLPHLSSSELFALPYPPNLLPGARDVKTPYGTMRVYEWGPQGGRKVMLIHGDTTPGPILAPIANALVKRGCRVMIFDLWGRGYTDTPLGIPHDAKLFGNQIFFAAASSPLTWISPESGGFSIVAFSLGGAVAMSFIAYFPYLVNSIVLLAPGGILRRLPQKYKSQFFHYPRLVPYRYLRKLVANTIGVQASVAAVEQTKTSDARDIADLDMAAIIKWQFDHHKGFTDSFASTIAYGPLMHQHSDWKAVCNIIKGNVFECSESNQSSKLFGSKILVILGESDGVVPEKDLSTDLLDIIGDPQHLEIKVVPGSHGFPVPSCDLVVKHICNFWDLPVE